MEACIMMRRICTTDLINLHDIPDPTEMPYVVEGTHYNDLTIYFESEENKQAYLAIPVECPATDMRVSLDNPTEVFIDEG
jgi:hypothetical protein